MADVDIQEDGVKINVSELRKLAEVFNIRLVDGECEIWQREFKQPGMFDKLTKILTMVIW